MVNQQLLDYIKQQLQAGVSKEAITSALVSQGWQQQDIDEAMANIQETGRETMGTSVAPVAAKKMGSKKINILLLIGYGIASLALMDVLYTYLFPVLLLAAIGFGDPGKLLVLIVVAPLVLFIPPFLYLKRNPRFIPFVFPAIIVLIIILTVVAGRSTHNIVAQTRDVARGSDMDSITIALTNYYHDTKRLPSAITSTPEDISKSGADLCHFLIPKYISALPSDPLIKESHPIRDCDENYDTGYWVAKDASNDNFTVTAPDAETKKIKISSIDEAAKEAPYRDNQRFLDLQYVQQQINFTILRLGLGATPKILCNDSPPPCRGSSTDEGGSKSDGTGWVKIANVTVGAGGNPPLRIDPTNDQMYHYTYATDASGTHYELEAVFETNYLTQRTNVSTGGNEEYDSATKTYKLGTDLTILP